MQVVERQAGRKVMVDTAGASLGGFDAQKGQHEFSWRDAMDIPVRWRQISEPNDQVSQHNNHHRMPCSIMHLYIPMSGSHSLLKHSQRHRSSIGMMKEHGFMSTCIACNNMVKYCTREITFA